MPFSRVHGLCCVQRACDLFGEFPGVSGKARRGVFAMAGGYRKTDEWHFAGAVGWGVGTFARTDLLHGGE